MNSRHEGRPPHPEYGAPQSGAPCTIEGVTFRPYRIGVLRSAWISDDFRMRITDSPYSSGRGGLFRVSIDGREIKGRRCREHAVRDAIATMITSEK